MPRITARRLACSLALGTALVASGGCSNAGEGAISGAGLGALAGLIIGSTTGAAGEGAAIGAAIGGLGGAVIGDQNKRQEQSDRARNSQYESRQHEPYHDYGYERAPARETTTIYRTYEYPAYERRTYYRTRSGVRVYGGTGFCW